MILLRKEETEADLIEKFMALFRFKADVCSERFETVGSSALSEDAARFPCLATLRTPDDAITNAEVVEMLKLWALSPPVPTISRRSRSFSKRVAASRIAAAQPVISSMVSAFVLFVERAARNAAFCVGVVARRS